ncbi:MAG: VOC family protein [Clostridia bacterium]|nr:VOC family protein [Clostridia bacterium]
MFYNWSTINVSDMQKSLDFYCGLLKLEVVRKIGEIGDPMCICFLGEQGKTQHELICNATKPEPSATTSFGFTPDNLEEIVEACKDTAVKASERFWFVKDPDGYKIQLMIKQ